MEVLGEKGQCPFALAQHTERFWNVFFQTFRANALLQWWCSSSDFFIGYSSPNLSLTEKLSAMCHFWLSFFFFFS